MNWGSLSMNFANLLLPNFAKSIFPKRLLSQLSILSMLSCSGSCSLRYSLIAAATDSAVASSSFLGWGCSDFFLRRETNVLFLRSSGKLSMKLENLLYPSSSKLMLPNLEVSTALIFARSSRSSRLSVTNVMTALRIAASSYSCSISPIWLR